MAACLLTAAALAPSASATDIDVNAGQDTTADDGMCALREAVRSAATGVASGVTAGECAAGQPTLDRIVLDPGVTYTLSGAANDDLNMTGDLDVDGNGPVSIEAAPGSPAPSIDPNDVDRALDFHDLTAGDTASVDGIWITDGTAAFEGGAIRLRPGTTLELSDSSVTHSVVSPAFAQGGAIFVSPNATLEIASSLITLNQANGGNGTGQGGGIYVASGGSATIGRSVIGQNSISGPVVGSGGGGIHNEGALVLRDSTLRLNNGTFGKRGGGVSVLGAGASLTAVNATISSNTLTGGTSNAGGGLYVGGDVPVELIHTTFAGNSATDVGGDAIHVEDDDGAGTDVDVRASVVTGLDPFDLCEFVMSSGLTSESHNVSLQATCGLAGTNDVQVAAPGVGVLGDNGGPQVGAPGVQQTLQTNALAAGSTALDRVPTNECLDDMGAALTADARGSARPSNGACDSGAFELFVPPPGGGGTGGAGGGGVPMIQVPDCRGRPATVAGNNASQTLTGTSGSDVIVALGGSDTVRGLGGDDLVCGGSGRDRIKGGPGDDRLLGEAGRDSLFGQAGRDKLVGGPSKRDLCDGGGALDRKPNGCESRRGLP